MEILNLACFLLAVCAVLHLSLADEALSSASDQKPEAPSQTDDVAILQDGESLEKRWPHDQWAAANNWRKKWMAMNPWGKRWTNQFATWGKRNWNERPFATWGKRRPDWNFATWGKRAWNDRQFATWGKRAWNNRQFATWGKRAGDSLPEGSSPNDVADLDFPEKKAWNQFVTWGKRVPSDDVNKRWNTMATWGKRSSSGDDISNHEDAISNGSGLDSEQQQHHQQLQQQGALSSDAAADKRWNSFATWGKKWNTMSTWGKRDNNAEDADSLDKRWRSMATWGKRDSADQGEARYKRSRLGPWGKRVRAEGWSVMPTWGKRGRGQWGVLSTWGKRAAGDRPASGDDLAPPSTDDVLLRLFDRDG